MILATLMTLVQGIHDREGSALSAQSLEAGWMRSFEAFDEHVQLRLTDVVPSNSLPGLVSRCWSSLCLRSEVSAVVHGPFGKENQLSREPDPRGGEHWRTRPGWPRSLRRQVVAS